MLFGLLAARFNEASCPFHSRFFANGWESINLNQPAIPFPAQKRHNKAWALFQSMNLRAESATFAQALSGWQSVRSALRFCWLRP